MGRKEIEEFLKRFEEEMQLSKKHTNWKRIGLIFLISVFLLYISFFLAKQVQTKWKDNMISSEQTRTNVSYSSQTANTNSQTDDSDADLYLAESSTVDMMQEKTNMRAANENVVRRRLTDASQGNQTFTIDSEYSPQFGEETKIDGNQIIISISDYEVMQRIVEAEATGLDEKSKILVANVLLNRLRSSDFPNTIEEIVFQKVGDSVQFQPVSDGRYETVEVKDSTTEAVNKALCGIDYSEGALYFMARSGSTKSSESWFDENLIWLFEYEGHEFYK